MRRTTRSVRRCGKVLIIGPGEAKGELHARLLKMKLGDHVAAMRTEDPMTERELVATVRKDFSAGAPRVRATRSQ